jgi:hypothetical protein
VRLLTRPDGRFSGSATHCKRPSRMDQLYQCRSFQARLSSSPYERLVVGGRRGTHRHERRAAALFAQQQQQRH